MKVLEFIKLKQENMTVMDYALIIVKSSKNAPTLVDEPWFRMSKYILRVSNFIMEEYKACMIGKGMDLLRLITNIEQIKEEKYEGHYKYGDIRYKMRDYLVTTQRGKEIAQRGSGNMSSSPTYWKYS